MLLLLLLEEVSQFLLMGLRLAELELAAPMSTNMLILSSAMVSSEFLRGELLCGSMIWGGAFSNHAPMAATLSNIVSIVLCLVLSTVMIWGGAISHHDPMPGTPPDVPLPIATQYLQPLVLSFKRAPYPTLPTTKSCNHNREAPRNFTRHGDAIPRAAQILLATPRRRA